MRDYRPGDLEEVVELFRRAVHEMASRDYSPAQLAAWAPELPDLEAWSRRLQHGGMFVCERNGRIAGFTRVDDTGHLDLLFVHPEAQHQGIGQSLLDHAISWAAHHGIRRLSADVSITARPAFERAGFHELARQVVERRGVSLVNFRMAREVSAEPLNNSGDPDSNEK